MISTVAQPSKKLDDKTADFRLSDSLRQRGVKLKTIEALALDVAQSLNDDFQDGTAVSVRKIRETIMEDHPGAMNAADFRYIARGLVNNGLCEIKRKSLRLAYPLKEITPSKLFQLAAQNMQQELLQACNDCCGIGFRNRNVSAVAAVEALMTARFNTSKLRFSEVAMSLQIAGVLEEVPSKGTTAFRLTQSGDYAVRTKSYSKPPNKIPGFVRSFSDDAFNLFHVHFVNCLGTVLLLTELWDLLLAGDPTWTPARLKAALAELADAEALHTEYNAYRDLAFCTSGAESPSIVYADINAAVDTCRK